MTDATMVEMDAIERHLETVSPGMPIHITAAASPGDPLRGVKPDAVRQGDLFLIVATGITPDYVKVECPSDVHRQLVPGSTQGARHCLDSLDGVELYHPKEWTEESLRGPVFLLTKERTILHPTHGPVIIAAGLCIHTRYQKEYDKEQARERRARD